MGFSDTQDEGNGSGSSGVAETQVRNSSNAWTDVGYASGDLAMPVGPGLGITNTGTLATTGVLFTQDCAGYSFVSIITTAIFGGTLINFEVSNDNVTWELKPLIITPAGGGGVYNSSSVAGIAEHCGPISSRYFRVNVATNVVPVSVTILAYFRTTSPVVNYAATENVQLFDSDGSGILSNGGGLNVVLQDTSGGNFASVTGAGALAVDGSGVTQPIGVVTWGGSGVSLGQKVMNTSLPVVIASNQTAFAIGVADKNTYTYGTSIFQNVGGVFQDTSPSLTAGQSGAMRLTANRGMHVNLRDASGNEKLGQQLMAASIPVTMASDQTGFPVKLQDGLGNNLLSFGGYLGVSGNFGYQDLTNLPYSLPTTPVISGIYNDVGATVGAGQNGMLRITAVRGLHVNLRDSSGNEKLGSSTSVNSIPVVIASDQSSVTIGGTYNSTTPSLTNGATSSMQLDSGGNLKITPGSSGNDTSALYQAIRDQLEFMQSAVLELRAIRYALTAIATEGLMNVPDDFNPMATDFSHKGQII